ncbi:MAG TPA: DUF4412 domain-containing protein [Polyangiaceae bacterium]
MRNTISSAALLLVLGLGSPLAARAAAGDTGQAANGNFEGDVTMRISTDRSNGPQDVTVHVKGDQVRYDLPPSSNQQHEPMQAIVDMGKKRVMLVMPTQKTYAVLDMNKIPPESKQAAARRLEGAAADWTASPNGTPQTVAGRSCDPWQATDTKTNMKIDACLAPSVRIDFDRLLPSSLLPPAWTDKLRNGQMPMSATVHSADGKQTFDARVTSVTPKTVPASTFAAPAGYKQVTLPLTAFGDMLPRQ